MVNKSKDTRHVRIHKDLIKFIIKVKAEGIKRGKNLSTSRITRKMPKVLNIKDFIN